MSNPDIRAYIANYGKGQPTTIRLDEDLVSRTALLTKLREGVTEIQRWTVLRGKDFPTEADTGSFVNYFEVLALLEKGGE